MASFNSFTFTYSDASKEFRFDFDYTPGSFTYTIEAYINFTRVGAAVDTPNGRIVASEISYPQFFVQGQTMYSYLICPEDFQQTSNVYGVFQRKTDSNNISVNGNTKYIYAFNDTNSIKSVILPPISQSPFCTFFFKYLGTQKPASVCPYMSNVTYPINVSQFVETADNRFEGVFDAKLQGAFENISFPTALTKSCLGLFNNGSNWYYAGSYNSTSNQLTYGTSNDTTGALFDSSNSQILYHEYTSQSTIVLCNSPPTQFPKFVFFRNLTATSNVTVRIFAPPGVKIDSTEPGVGESAYVSFPLNNNEQRTVGFYYNNTGNVYYILTYFDSTSLTSSNVSGFVTLSNAFGYINDEDKNVQLTLPIQQPGYAKINTIAFFQALSATQRTLTVTAPPTSNVIILPNGNSETAVLSNVGSNIAYTFASFYNGPGSNSVTIPLYNSILF